MTSELIKRKTYQGLIDFDNHLDDITLDWLNGAINDAVSVEPSWLVGKKTEFDSDLWNTHHVSVLVVSPLKVIL